MKNKKGIIISISVAALILIIFGVSYAYFSAQITGEESSTTLTVSGGSISLTVNGGNNINVENIIPGSGAVATKSITITSNNTTELTSPYTLNMVVESNTFSDNAITYTLTSTNNDNNGTVIPGVSEQTGLASGQSTINFGNGYFEPGSGVSHTYTLKLYFLETEADQNNDQGKVITAYFYIASAKAVTKEELLSMGVTYNPDGDSVYSQSKTVTVSASNELNNVASVKYLWSSLTSVTDEELFTETVENGGTVTTPELTGDYYLYTLVTDAEDNSEIHQSAVYKIDNQDPVITITGSNPLTIYKGDTYTELGATASDVQDGDLTSSIVTSGSVNTSVIGTYTITYTVSDGSGNETTATRTVNVANNLLASKILGPSNANVSSALTTPGQKVTLSTFDSLAESTLSVSSTTQAYYWTYGTGYTSNGDGTYNLTGVSTLLYSSNYSDLVGKYLVANSEYSCSSSTDTQKTSTNLTSVIKVTSATSSSLNYKQNYNPSDTGEAVLASTADDYGTSYYYRGSVENNYVVFANMCWRIVRITGNGAIKLALYNYNGSSVSNPCASAYDSTTAAFARYSGSTYTSQFNTLNPDNSYIGLMYATLSPIQSSSTSTKVMNISGESSYYASSYTYNSSTGTFTLSGSMISGLWSSVGSSAVSTYPYTCKLSTSSGSCSILYKVSSYLNSTYGDVYRIIGSATTYAATHTNTNKSTILNNLETWYSTNLSSYSSYLADTIWCNDKSMSTASTYLGYGTNQTYYKAYQRLNTASTATPSLVCPNDASGGKLSKYTADETTYGNGALNYKIGLLTADELAFAGITSSTSNASYYLYKNASNENWWTMSPYQYDGTNFQATLYTVQAYSTMAYNRLVAASSTTSTYALRPSIALVSTTTVTGSGTSSNPYVVTGY